MKKDSPLLLLFSSGTSGKPIKPTIYTKEDKNNMEQCAKRFCEIQQQSGVYYNLMPFAPHLGFYQGAIYGEIMQSLTINTGGGKHLTSEKTVAIMKSFPPELILGSPNYILKVLKLAKENEVDLDQVRLIMGANGLPTNFTDKCLRLCPNATIYASYGFTEARGAWTTCSQLSCGYHVFPESGRFEIDPKNNELIFFSKYYPAGFRTGDRGSILSEEICPNCGQKCQRVGFKIKRLDGMSKHYDF
jgi:phenylacetate-coenzyme A ligase PaaK-like adenylate-forming protein